MTVYFTCASMFTQPYRYDSQMAFCGHLNFAITTAHMAFLASAASQKEKERMEKTLYRPDTILVRKFLKREEKRKAFCRSMECSSAGGGPLV